MILTRGELVEDQRFGWDRCSLKGRFKYKQIENQRQIQKNKDKHKYRYKIQTQYK